MWVWRDDVGSGGAVGGGWRLDAYGTWVWDEPSPLDRPGAGIGALRGRGGDRLGSPVDSRVDDRVRELRREVGDRALATLDPAGEPTPIFHELTVDRTRRVPRRPARRDRDAVHVPEPHPGSGALPVQDASGGRGSGRGLREVPTVPPPPAPSAPSAPSSPSSLPELAESPEDELRRRAERRRRPMASGAETASGTGREGGRHTWRREEDRTGRHALRR